MEKEICTISIGDGWLDNDYTFYESGKIKHFYDQSTFKTNQERWIEADEISDSKKARLLEKCEEQFREQIIRMLS